MSKGINKVFLIGHLGADPDVRHLNNGTAVANVSIATSEQWKDKQTGERQERTEWHRCTFWQRLAEIAGEYLQKGSKVYVEGKLQTDKYDKEGQTHYATKVIVREMQMLDSRGGARQTHSSAQTSAAPAPSGDSGSSGGADFDDDIPF